jgi:enoyl-CoA hydratase/carnithine racemase
MHSNDILVTRDGDVAIVTLNKPDRCNAWTRAMRNRLAQEIRGLADDDSVKALVFTGAGDRGFCTGQDFNESQGFDDDATSRAWLYEIKDLYDLVRSIEKPTIAALNGIAAGSGFQFALLMDFRIGHPAVTMGQPEINNGIPSVVGPWVMSERITLTQATDLALTGRLVDCDEAVRMSLINRVVPAERVLFTAVELARELGAKPPTALRHTKRAMRLSTQARFDQAFEIAEQAQVEAFASGEPQRCMEEFLRIRQARKLGETNAIDAK